MEGRWNSSSCMDALVKAKSFKGYIPKHTPFDSTAHFWNSWSGRVGKCLNIKPKAVCAGAIAALAAHYNDHQVSLTRAFTAFAVLKSSGSSIFLDDVSTCCECRGWPVPSWILSARRKPEEIMVWIILWLTHLPARSRFSMTNKWKDTFN